MSGHYNHGFDDGPVSGGSETSSEFHFTPKKEETKSWDVFKQTEQANGSASERHTDFFKAASIFLKLITMLITFSVVLLGGAVSKSAIFYIISQMSTKTPDLEYCMPNSLPGTNYTVQRTENETIAWSW